MKKLLKWLFGVTGLLIACWGPIYFYCNPKAHFDLIPTFAALICMIDFLIIFFSLITIIEWTYTDTNYSFRHFFIQKFSKKL